MLQRRVRTVSKVRVNIRVRIRVSVTLGLGLVWREFVADPGQLEAEIIRWSSCNL